MPEVTVSMPTRDNARYLRQAIESVLSQEGIDLDLVVVDDASEDDTAKILASLSDPRLRVLRNRRPMGIGFSHNRVLEVSDAPFVAHVDSDDFILPGALRKMVDALRANPSAGQAHCHFLTVDPAGQITREAAHRRWEYLHRRRPVGMDYRRELITRSVINHLRTYRRAALEEIGGFDERTVRGCDKLAGIRIADRFDIVLVPEMLYVHRLRGAAASRGRFWDLRNWWNGNVNLWRLAQPGGAAYVRARRLAVVRARLGMLRWLLRPPGLRDISPAISRRARSAARWLDPRLHRAVDRAYRAAVAGLQARGIGPGPAPRQAARRTGPVAWFAWDFPVLTQTFVQREVRALREAGVPVRVIAGQPMGELLLDADARELLATTLYLSPNGRGFGRALASFIGRPMRLARLFLYAVSQRHGPVKTPVEDLRVFGLGVILAAVARDEGCTRIHVPWANRSAFVGIVAARLLGIPYTVHARAYDVHRDGRFAVADKLERADGILTNCRYNADLLSELLPDGARGRVRVVYNGLDLSRLRPLATSRPASGTLRVLCVARLVEQKGLARLLDACRLLADRGIDFRCEVVGGADEPRSTNTAVDLMLQRRRLGLEEQVRFTGAMPFDRVLGRYADADVFALPAVVAGDGGRDVTPNSLLEAMALALPCISTPVAGIPEIVDDGVCGLLVPPGDAPALANAIERLWNDPALRRRLGAAARARIEDRFDMDKNVLELVAFFGESRDGVYDRK